MEFINDYGLFLAKTLTLLVAIFVVVMIVAAVSGRARKMDRGYLEVKSLDDSIRQMRRGLRQSLLSAQQRKLALKAWRREEKAKEKKRDKAPGKRIFVLDFKGDLRASGVQSLREEITALLGEAGGEDEVVVRLESAGGMVHSYGLAASQLDRIRKQGIPLTVCVDKVAASGGYMMACVADRILAAPFAIMGSIGVVAQLPNFHRLLKKHDVDFEVLTAGRYKRTLTLFGENTEQARDKFRDDLEETHTLFKDFIRQHRSAVDVDAVATGEVWLGTRALELGLVDEVMTSDEYLTGRIDDASLFQLRYVHRKSLPEKFGMAAEESADGLLLRWIRRLYGPGFYS